MLRSFFVMVILLAGLRSAVAQNELQGIVLNAYTGAPVSGAMIRSENPQVALQTDSNGAFRISTDTATESLVIRVKALGTDTSFEVFPQSASLLEWRVIPKGMKPTTATIQGMTARQIVEKAIQNIPLNYPDSSYVYYGFYRQYQQSGTQFQNLVEAQVAAAILPKKVKRGLEAQHFFAILQSGGQAMTQTKIPDVDIREGLSEQLFEENPVYFPSNGSFVGRLFDVSQFRFDSSFSGNDEYRIQYSSELSSEDHGFEQKFATHSAYLESYETGTLVIDPKTFAFKHISRKAHRLPGADYYHRSNWVRPAGPLSRELVSGQLDIRYEPRGEKWFLSQIIHGYCNDYYSHRTFMRLHGRLSEFFEWQTASVSEDIPKALVQSFTPKPYVQFATHIESGFIISETRFPFLFFPEETVRTSLTNFRK